MNIAAKIIDTGLPWVALAIPLLLVAGSLLVGRFAFTRLDLAWRLSIFLGGLCLMAASVVAAGASRVPIVVSPLGFAEASGLPKLTLRVDALGCAMLVLVTFLGWVVLRFSRRYLAGEKGQLRYLRWLQLTLAAVTMLLLTNNLLVLAVAWMGTSLALHQLLIYYRDRPLAFVAAHKKFLLSRLADLCLFAAVLLVGRSLGTLEIDEMLVAQPITSTLSAEMHLAMVLVAVTAVLKCAQLPFHGWLIQVMEAPTPVSALLHAGVVNIGGFVLIRLAPIGSKAEFAQALLIVAGVSTATLAALVMMTRISVKVMLAWSTCAQMGLMLVQCGLGAYSLALLHLVAHSLYKAHAFLYSGNVVAVRRQLALIPKPAPVGFPSWLLAGFASAALVFGLTWLVGIDLIREPSWWLPACIVALSLPALALNNFVSGRPKSTAMLLGIGLIIPVAYYLWHGVFAWLLLPTHDTVSANGTICALASAAFVALYLTHAWISSHPSKPVTRWLYRYAYNGFYLDELFTRMTSRLWPAKLISNQRHQNVEPSVHPRHS